MANDIIEQAEPHIREIVRICRVLEAEGRVSVQTGAIALVSWLMLFLFFRSGRKAGSYLLASIVA
jgi:hypothetical protein